MSFIASNSDATVYAPGYFLAKNEDCVRLTAQFADDMTSVETAANGGKYVPMGTVYPSNDTHAVGIVYEDVDVSEGDAPGSVVYKGVVYEDLLAEELDSDAKTALIAAGFVFLEAPTVTRP